MVCEYCGSPTSVINSRHQKRSNQIWRRRRCRGCGALFTTHESVYLPAAFSVNTRGQIKPFVPDKLFAEILLCLQDRSDVYIAARELSATITRKLLKRAADGLISSQDISAQAAVVLKRFDRQAYLRYLAEHPSLHI